MPKNTNSHELGRLETLCCQAQIGSLCHFKGPTKKKQSVSTNISLSALSIKYGKKVYLDNPWCMFVAKMSDTKFICYIIYVASMYIIVCLCMATTGLVNYFLNHYYFKIKRACSTCPQLGNYKKKLSKRAEIL